jgi:hypothetical protein
MMRTTAERRQAVMAFLRGHGAEETPHIFGDLLSHLVGVEALVREWGGSDLLALAALGHATYGTDGFEPFILEPGQRSELVDAIGPDAEAFVYFYAACDRDVFYQQLASPETELGALSFRDRFTGSLSAPSAEYVALFVDLTYANEVELACASPGGPTEWTWLADFCRDTRRWASPKFFDGASALLRPPGLRAVP